jgi:hypothetical protein
MPLLRSLIRFGFGSTKRPCLRRAEFMAFKLYNKKQLKVGVFLFGFGSLWFLLLSFFGDSLGGHIEINGHVLQKSDPDYAHELLLWRIGMIVGALFSGAVAWFCHWRSRKMLD